MVLRIQPHSVSQHAGFKRANPTEKIHQYLRGQVTTAPRNQAACQ